MTTSLYKPIFFIDTKLVWYIISQKLTFKSFPLQCHIIQVHSSLLSVIQVHLKTVIKWFNKAIESRQKTLRSISDHIPRCLIIMHIHGTYTLQWAHRSQMHSYCLNLIPLFPSICSPQLVLLLHAIPENEMSSMRYISPGRDTEQRDLPSFYKWYQINEWKVCQLWNYCSSGSLLFLLRELQWVGSFDSACAPGLLLQWVVSCQGLLCVQLFWWGQTQTLS